MLRIVEYHIWYSFTKQGFKYINWKSYKGNKLDQHHFLITKSYMKTFMYLIYFTSLIWKFSNFYCHIQQTTDGSN